MKSTGPILGLALWVLFALGLYWLFAPGNAVSGPDRYVHLMLLLLASVLPAILIWVAITVTGACRRLQDENERLITAIDALRHDYVTQSQSHSAKTDPVVARKLDETVTALRRAEIALNSFSTSRQMAQLFPILPEAAPDDQAALPLGSGDQKPRPLSRTDLINALQFPENAEDTQGFDVMRRALKDGSAGELVQAAQNILTLLSQDGIYMDELRHDSARPDIWRRFAQGARGRSIAALGGVRDRSALAVTIARMKRDRLFRDGVHEFLQQFEEKLKTFIEPATDAEIAALSDTRTARAFMLLGRVAGIFD